MLQVKEVFQLSAMLSMLQAALLTLVQHVSSSTSWHPFHSVLSALMQRFPDYNHNPTLLTRCLVSLPVGARSRE